MPAGGSSWRTSRRAPCSPHSRSRSAARVYVGEWSWRDLLPPLLLLAAQPFVEWVIHKYLLHLPAMTIRGRRVELYGSIQHRNHHLDPADLGRVLLKPIEVISFIVQIAIVIALITLAVAGLTGWPVTAARADRRRVRLSRPAALRVVALPDPHALCAQDTLVPDGLAQPPPAPLQARGLLDGRQLKPRRPPAGNQPRPAVDPEVTDRAHPRRTGRVAPPPIAGGSSGHVWRDIERP